MFYQKYDVRKVHFLRVLEFLRKKISNDFGQVLYCIGILYLQTFLEGHYGIVIYSNVNTKSLMLFIHVSMQQLNLCSS